MQHTYILKVTVERIFLIYIFVFFFIDLWHLSVVQSFV